MRGRCFPTRCRPAWRICEVPLADNVHAAEPSPIGLIRFSAAGPLEKAASVDVQLSYKNGRVLGHWPARKSVRPPSSGGTCSLARRPDRLGVCPRALGWETVRSGLPLRSEATREPFLLYDVELAYPVVMQVTGGKGGKYSVAQGMEAPLRDLTLYKRATDGHWRTASLAASPRRRAFRPWRPPSRPRQPMRPLNLRASAGSCWPTAQSSPRP